MARRWFFTSLFAALTLATAVVALVRLAEPAGPNLIVLTVEGARREAFSAETTPNLWRAARSGTRFGRHRAVSAWTGPNVIAVLTGISPFDQGVHTRGNSVPRSWRLPLEDLADWGWRVAGLQSFMQMDLFRDLGLTVEPGADPFQWMARRAAERRPFVLWYHYVGTHLPYAPAPPFRPALETILPRGDAAARRRIDAVMTMPAIPAGTVSFQPQDRPAVEALYRGGFKEFDAWFAGLWDFLALSGLRDHTIVVLTADHGEELLERGNVGHASTTRSAHLYEEIVRTPLVLWVPRRIRSDLPAQVDAVSDHLDIMPTVFALFGRKPSRRLPGTDLFALPPAKPWSAVTSRAGFAEPDPKNLRHFVYARLEYPWKLHLETVDGKAGPMRLFNLAADAGETRDLSAVRRDVANRLGDRLLPAILAMRPPAVRTPAAPLAADRPRWVFPAASGDYGYGDLSGRFRLQWTGKPDARYIVQYVAGEGVLRLEGEIEVRGTTKDFGVIDRRYWDTWIVPYRRFRIRVGVAGARDLWSEWLDLRAKS